MADDGEEAGAHAAALAEPQPLCDLEASAAAGGAAATGQPAKAKSRLSAVGKAVLARVSIEAAFGTLRKSSTVDDALDYTMLERIKLLGKGSYGEVALYRWKPNATVKLANGEVMPRTGLVAIKSLLPTAKSSPSALEDFQRETAILSRLSHSCLVGCIGSGEFPDRKTGAPLLFLAMEAVTGGDLRNVVLDAMMKPGLYKDADIVRWCHDIARGLHYLHTRSPMVIHRDLKLENILLDATWSAKLTDFGLVKSIMKPAAHEQPTPDDKTYSMTGGTGSLKYMAPEVFMNKNATQTVDNYSFSIIMWECLARKMLLFMRVKHVQHYKVEYTPKLWATDATKGVRPEQPEAWPAELRALMAECWDADPAKRPSFKSVVDRLAPLLQPELFTDPTKKPGPEGGCCSLQ